MQDALEWQLDVQLPPVPRPNAEESYTTLLDPAEHLAFRLHPNTLCLVSLAPSHPMLQAGGGSGGGSGGVGEPAAAAAAPQAAAGAAAPDAAAGQDGSPAPDAGGSAAAANDQQQQQQAAPPPASQQAAELALSPKLLQAEFRKGRGPLLQRETILGRLTAGGVQCVLRCGVRGLLVELNERLQGLRGAELLRALQASYIAILELRAAERQQLEQQLQRQGPPPPAA